MTPVTAMRWRWRLIGVVALVVLVAAYILAVHSYTGQRLENAALRGSYRVNLDETTAADQALAGLTLLSIGLGVLLIGVVGLVRGGVRLAAAGLGVVAIAGVCTELLKDVVLRRPDLVDAPVYLQHNSFPSGHTAMATGIACATLVVMPWRWRTPVLLVATVWAGAVSAYTVVARWHRLSDIVGAQALALLGSAVAVAVMLRAGMIRESGHDDAPPVRGAVIVLGVGYALGGGALGVWLGHSGAQAVPGDDADFLLYAAVQILATVGTVVTMLVSWWGWRGVEPVRPRRR